MIPLRDTVRSRSFPIVNWLLIGTNVLVFLFEKSLGPRAFELFVGAFGLVPAYLTSASPFAWITVFTSMFLHGGWLHLIANMWALYIFGDNVEDRMGHGRYLFFYLAAGVAGGLLQVATGPNSIVPMVGASGAIAGVLGAYLLLYPRARVVTLIPIFFLPWFVELPALLYLGFWFVSQFFGGVAALGAVAGGGVAYWAHVGGFVAGLSLVHVFASRQDPQRAAVEIVRPQRRYRLVYDPLRRATYRVYEDEFGVW
ncbi:MAG: rhomboid family intramembrane serine protease [Anaerolineales bacterium]